MDRIKAVVRESYGAVARSELGGSDAGARKIAQAFGYSLEELASVPSDANLGLSCGNPTAMAGLRPGEVVVDLGCGGGLDVFLAARKVGPSGRAIGIDMTADMIERARRNAGSTGLANVEFHLGEIESLPVADQSVDCVISNCVLNLVPDKTRAFAEIHRVLRPGGRLAASDIALKKPLPAELADDLVAYIGCIAGAIGIPEYVQSLHSAGFGVVQVIDSHADLNAYAELGSQAVCCAPAMEGLEVSPAPTGSLEVLESGCCGAAPAPSLPEGLSRLLRRYDINEYAASVKVFAVKGGP